MPSRRRQFSIWSATCAGAVEPKLAIRSTAREAPNAARSEAFQPAYSRQNSSSESAPSDTPNAPRFVFYIADVESALRLFMP